MRRRLGLALLRLARLPGDLLLGWGALAAATALRTRFQLPFTERPLPAANAELVREATLPVLLVLALAMALTGFYEAARPLPRLELARRLLLAAALQGAGLVAFFFLLDRPFPRSVLLLHLALAAAALYAWRWAVQRLDRPRSRRVAVVGTGPAARELARTIAQHRYHGLSVAGHVRAPGEEERGPESALGPELGGLDGVCRLLEAGQIDDLVFAAESEGWRTAWVGHLTRASRRRGAVLLLPGPFDSLIGRMRYRWVHDLPLIEVVRPEEWRLRLPVKRAFDLAAGALLGIAALPLVAAAALAVRWTSRGPVLYRQERIGRGLEPFSLVKLRTMVDGAERETGEVLATPDDPRLTPVGGLLRRTRLDELPQLWNVLRGEMSLVGPRPERPGFVARYLEEVPGYAERFLVPPGLTGLAQVNGEYDSSPQNKLRYDLAYLANWSLSLDLSILFRTAKIVLTSRGL
ncbi:MAG TPA: exopolysaccharide biosynthesis polyprenyl glycosylphosphotransferase [Thermoanaerobaculia bacterium]|nr:exopolysaccharide biosynthesis polyprenyl glycosylphosphotransferase [Thermoanaerobaculia bacterium]